MIILRVSISSVMRLLLFFLTLVFTHSIYAQSEILTNTITFYAKDSVIITADTYFLENISPTVLLCHQAGYSRGEYLETAKKLNALGFSCMAIDQRSGNEVNGIVNQTAIDANLKQRNVGYAGAKQDVEAAIEYLYNMNGNEPIILIGSSYSASLALWIASQNKKVKTVAAFSPGEYLNGKNLAEIISPLNIPTFVTSSKRESAPVKELLRFVKSKQVTHYIPEKNGIHGSRAIWETTDGYLDYWKAFKTFLLANK